MDDESRKISQIKADIAARAEQAWQGGSTARPMHAGASGGGCAAAIIAIIAVVGTILYFRAGGAPPGGNAPGPPQPPGAKNASFPTLPVGDADWGYGTEPGRTEAASIRTACIEAVPGGVLWQPRGKLCVRSGEEAGEGEGDRAGDRAGGGVLIRPDDPGQFGCGAACQVSVRFDDGPPQSYAAARPLDGPSDTLRLADAERFIAGARSAKAITLQAATEARGARSATPGGRQTLSFRPAAPLVWN